MKKVCVGCKIFVEGSKCPLCNKSELSDSWKGKVMIIDPEQSEISKRLKITKAGKYAIKTK